MGCKKCSSSSSSSKCGCKSSSSSSCGKCGSKSSSSCGCSSSSSSSSNSQCEGCCSSSSSFCGQSDLSTSSQCGKCKGPARRSQQSGGKISLSSSSSCSSSSSSVSLDCSSSSSSSSCSEKSKKKSHHKKGDKGRKEKRGNVYITVVSKEGHPNACRIAGSKAFAVNGVKGGLLKLVRGRTYNIHFEQKCEVEGRYDNKLFFTMDVSGGPPVMACNPCKLPGSFDPIPAGTISFWVDPCYPDFFYYQSKENAFLGGTIVLEGKRQEPRQEKEHGGKKPLYKHKQGSSSSGESLYCHQGHFGCKIESHFHNKTWSCYKVY